jgi:hypothetical protein
MDKYWKWKLTMIEAEKDKTAVEKAKVLREELKEVETDYCYEKIASFRQIANQKHKIQLKKFREQEELKK